MQLQLEDQEREAYRKRQLFWMEFLAKRYSHIPPPGVNAEAYLNAQERFMMAINPDGIPQKTYEWNIPKEVLEEAERLQREGTNEGPTHAVMPVKKGGN